MKKQFLLAAFFLLGSLAIWADTYTITFNSGETGSDSSQETNDISKIIRSCDYDCVQAIRRTQKIFRAKDGYGIKGGTGTISGHLVMELDTTYTVRTITLWAAAGNKSDTAKTKGITVCGQEVLWKAPRLELQPYTITLNQPLDSIDIHSITEKNNRFYIEHIELDIEDTYNHFGAIQMPAGTHKFPSMEYDSVAPAADEESFELRTKGLDASGIRLAMKQGSVFQISPSTLTAEGGEFTVSYETNAKPGYYDIVDTCIITAKGQNGRMITKRMAVTVMVYEPKPYVVDSTDMYVSVAPMSDYYLPAEQKTDSALKSELGRIICRGNRYRYGSGNHKTWAGFYYTDHDTTTHQVLDMYSHEERYFNPERPTASVSGFDIEHMLPKSWWGGTVNRAYCDLYHLVPGDNSANRSKSNHAPGIPTDTTFNNGSFVTGPDALHGLARVFCPEDEYKGDFARAYFYIACAYGDSLHWVETAGSEPAEAMTNDDWQEFRPRLRDLLLDWHRMDPVSEKEKQRAIEVNKIQGNRNPFIDYPDLVEYIWGDRQGEICSIKRLPGTFDTPIPTGCQPVHSMSEAIRRLENGQLIVIRDGNRYTVMGIRIP